MTENALKRKFNGGNPTVGYQIDKDQYFQINPLAAPHVLEAFKLYDKGATMTCNSVSKMLRNRRYIGECSYRDMVIINGIPAIVSEKLFERVQQRVEKNRKAPARHKAEEDYLLTTKLFCGYCGVYLCGESGTSHTGVYECVSVKKKRTDCKKKLVRKHWIEDLVIKATIPFNAQQA